MAGLDPSYPVMNTASAEKNLIYSDNFVISVSNDEKEATVMLLEPVFENIKPTLDDVKEKLYEGGITHGIDVIEIKAMLATGHYNIPYVIALATPPEDGEDGRLLFHFSTDKKTGKPLETDSDGKVDYYSLDLYVPVIAGQLLVTRIPATKGTPGKTITGKDILPKPGKEAVMPRGKNVTLDDNRTQMSAACSGMVEYVNNMVNVSNVYRISGDCDISTGNIDFEGSVYITGSVRSGITVKAADGIFIAGSVEAATLISGGNVDIKGGILGADKGSIDAQGAVSFTFAERCRVSADGNISFDVSIHSILETAGSIRAFGRRGAIIGGKASAAGDIIAGNIGSLSGVKTEINVGFMPKKRALLERLEEELDKIKKDQAKLAQLDAYLTKNKGTMDQATWEKLYVSGKENRRNNDDAAAAHIAQIELIKHQMENATSSKVHVFDAAFTGSRITIGAALYIITDDISHVTFKYRNGEITFSSCESTEKGFLK